MSYSIDDWRRIVNAPGLTPSRDIENRGGVCDGCHALILRTFAFAVDGRGEGTYYLCRECYEQRVDRALGTCVSKRHA